ncbi:glycoside hydrolase family 130 protein [Streptacidiphilus fuscans]|uniref:Glycosylase n=1 Tax=Streptacidiphilus fuscans TaxID=2789292 RepID=A0A931B2H0_9ACTN|nr:glycoside hydrolase family 130 protein [Streptacidiphilus fuscans]MBF9069058.1 glycosylase [Streptacidiphilus fuscans]
MHQATFPLGPFEPSPHNPILRPHGTGWESTNLYNPAALVVDDEVILLYRAHAADKISRIGLARSSDGIHFRRAGTPVLEPQEPYEQAGCEDPRITHIADTYYLTYTGFDGSTAQLCLATSTDLHEWTRHGPLFPGFNTWKTLPYGPDRPWSKAGVIHPRPLAGRYWMWFGEGTIHAATSTDLVHWTPVADDSHPMYSPTPGGWDGTLVEIGAPPVESGDGLLVFLMNNATATSPEHVDYRCGQIAVATRDPSTVLAKMTQPWLRPTSHEDTHGLVPNVTFVEGLVHFRGRWLAYYGQSDTTLAVAEFDPTRHNWHPPAQDAGNQPSTRSN